MQEKDKMLSGMLYNANQEELVWERRRAKQYCDKFNRLSPAKEEKQRKLLRRLLGSAEGEFTILPSFWCDYGYNIHLGNHFLANHHLVILDCAKVSFGDNVLIGPNCGFYTAGHPKDTELRNQGLEYAYPIAVGDNVWFGGGVQVCPGVRIGSNVIIGAGSVVIHDIPSNVIAAGNPCWVIRRLADEEEENKGEEV